MQVPCFVFSSSSPPSLARGLRSLYTPTIEQLISNYSPKNSLASCCHRCLNFITVIADKFIGVSKPLQYC